MREKYASEQEANDRGIAKFDRSFVERDGCWIWIRGLCTGGYGQISVNGKYWRAHRFAYEMAYDVNLTPDQFLHHTCGNKPCVNPKHLEITSQLGHVDSATFGNKYKTHCPHGHEYTPENICWNKNGKARECRICKYARIRRRDQRIREERQRLRAEAEDEFREGMKKLLLKYEAADALAADAASSIVEGQPPQPTGQVRL